MLAFLSKPRSPSYHRRTMLKVALLAAVLYVAWEPIRPVRLVTAEALYTAGDMIRR